jgi:selenocysteine lyase/cysteine desulfurase
MGTLETGTVRVVPSVFTTKSDIDRLINVIRRI